ncbi:MAG: 16S rRNA (cytosine967-C5)-methyltransferase [Candidatus Magnetoglobus multicellularis str. Araruama]|uniref:16S rRNA (cytosine(967)-C(5))-methyltransferase n=1 Tax=Candidatus Magnetoglobus multicellularis str. Araruama TaxID=890399 RepID=A0A1V1PIH5_9BACT|nr:MAG: 16S rRNA (cytosine967-C5)-methyltransferase [Candidatus Magnetoglobus multicellularis str. Araruama]
MLSVQKVLLEYQAMKQNNQFIQSKLKQCITNNPRAFALFTLNEFHLNEVFLDALLNDHFCHVKGYEQRDRALIHSLVYGVIRWRLYLDFIIDQCASSGCSKIELPVLNVLRMGLFQLLFLDRIPDHAAVNTSVELIRLFAPNYLSRFVNGVLRGCIRSKGKIRWPDETTHPIDTLSVKYAYPKWLVKRWIEYKGIADTKALCRYGNEVPPIILRTNTLKTSRSHLLELLSSDFTHISKTFHSPDGICLSSIKLAVGQLDSFKKGLYQVQDEAAQLISLIVSPRPGETILDACAGRGGKTGHLAQFMNNKGTIFAVDHSSEKRHILSHEMQRLGVSIVKIRQHRWEKVLNNLLFDRVLVDAPCSGLGVIRRHPDMKWKKTQRHIFQNARQQKKSSNMHHFM